MRIDIPDELADVYREAPVVDIFEHGPWRVPEGLFESIRDKATALAGGERFSGWQIVMGGSYYATPTNGVGPTIDLILDTLMGAGAIRSGWWGELVYVMTDPFVANPPARRPGWEFYPTQGPQWPPPGRSLLRAAGEQRQLALTAEREILDLFEGFEPVERRRQAMIRLWDTQLAEVDATLGTEELIVRWRAAADTEMLAAMPELGGPTAYLQWVVDGLVPVHGSLLAAVGSGPDIEQTLADLLHIVDADPPAALSGAVGPDRLARIAAAHSRSRESFDKSRWQEATNRWLGRAAVLGQLPACRAWLDMAERYSASCSSLPDLPNPPSRRWVPLRGFEQQIRDLISAPVIANPLAQAFRSAPTLVAPTAVPADTVASSVVGQPELSAALAELPTAGPIRLLVAGPDGSGQGLAVSAAEEALAARGLARAPAWLPASLFSGKDVSQAVTQLRTEVGGAGGRGLLVIDGLDELVAQGEPGAAAAEELRRSIEARQDLHVVALCDADGDRQVFGVNPALTNALRVVHLVDFDRGTFEVLLHRALERLGATVEAATLAAAAELLVRTRPFRNMRNGHLVDAMATQVVTTARRRSSSARPLIEIVDLPTEPDLRPGGRASASTGDPLNELDHLVGLAAVKREVRLLSAEAKVATMRHEAGLHVKPPTRHLAFTGNPGTAKTTVARLLARLYRDVGLLSSGHLVEVSRVDLVAEYIGQTAPRVRGAVERALGGILFIDEAYALAGRTTDDFGAEAIATLVKLMEDHRGDLVVIVAGYEREMGAFLASNSGLASRFARRLHFPDYSDAELRAIFDRLAADDGLTLGAGVDEAVAAILRATSRGPGFGNARFVRNLLDTALGAQAIRLTGEATALDTAGIRTLLAADLPEPDRDTAHERPIGQYL